MLMMNVTKKPVHIQTTNKWANRKTDVDGELEVELDRLTIRDDKERTRKNQSEPIVHFNDSLHGVDEDDDEHDDDPDEVRSTTPDGYKEGDRLFHLNFLRHSAHPNGQQSAFPKKYKNGTRKSLSFSNERMRDIERTNRILLQKILSKGPSQRRQSAGAALQNNSECQSRVSSATVNRRKQQRQIDMDNELLRRKLHKIAARK